jgi:hypothetical protein
VRPVQKGLKSKNYATLKKKRQGVDSNFKKAQENLKNEPSKKPCLSLMLICYDLRKMKHTHERTLKSPNAHTVRGKNAIVLPPS